IVVVSAMAGQTNHLIDLARGCSKKPAPRELDSLLATGEQMTTALLSMALIDRGYSAKSLSAYQAKIETTSRHNRAHILGVDSNQIQSLIDSNTIPVIAGFQGVVAGDLTTLGRGGSDITAVAIAAAVKADSCHIYTDVKGVYTADPRICANATLRSQVCYEEMLEMASRGAKVLHPRSVYFAMAYQVPLVVRSTFEPGPGTSIVKEDELMEKPVVTGITYQTDQAKITVQKLPKATENFAKLFAALANEDVYVDMITQTGFDADLTDLSFTVPDECSDAALEVSRRMVPEFGAQAAICERDIAKVSVVGIGMQYHSGVAARMFSALSEKGIRVE
ncbi:MAG: aspartate kinase, partial [Bdellovibrionales bacterium]|nr:aspartate kinase [Bdellovibrionales bacterium]